MLTRRSLLQGAAAVIAGSALAPALVAADPVATEYGRLGRARYIFPLDFPKMEGALSLPLDRVVVMQIPTFLRSTAPISIVGLDYDLNYRFDGRDNRCRLSRNYEGGREVNMGELDSAELNFSLRNEFLPLCDFLPSTVTIHGIVSKRNAARALVLA